MIDFHRRMLADGIRNRAFAQALEIVVVPGKTTVADIGSGTGFLALLASKLGAKECFLYETSDVIELSEKLAKENGVTNCRFIRKHSTAVKNPPKVDLVLSETLGNFALEEHILENLQDARRFLKPGGTMIPQSLRQFVVPVATKRFLSALREWEDVGFDLTFTAAQEMTMHNVYVREIDPSDLYQSRDSIRCWDEIDLTVPQKSIRYGKVEWTVDRSIAITGFCLFWECTLVPKITLSTSPLRDPTHWEQLYLPISEPLTLASGEKLSLILRSDSRYSVGINVQWRVRGSGKHWSMDMRKGHLE
ncbi:methyltransferase domain-containing protein [Candidatus Peregrinibacteria bacterium]|nr:methyltransferase domain-containing protein [Candidatus Peregrinibacteria bacterium]MBI3816089.1 methyltransferase domain-containing protein [Candidatus Peregrinibacteria bacterium]